MSSKREREYERRRLEKWQERQARARAARHRRNVVVGSIVGAAVVVAAVVIAVVSSDRSPAAEPTSTPTPTTSSSASAVDTSPRTGNGGVLPDASLAENRTWTGTISTNRGDIGVELYGDKAPQAVANFVELAKEGYFDETKCHRLVTTGIHVLQCGDPTATGTGGPGYSWGPIENAPADGAYAAGTLAMARQPEDGSSMGSQFFIMTGDGLDPQYAVAGRVVEGMDAALAADALGTGDGPPSKPVVLFEATFSAE